MRVNKITSLITAITSVLFAALCFFIPKDTVYYDISLAIFGSDLIAFVLSFIEYFSVRREVIEEFYVASLKALSSLKKIEYMHFDIQDEMLKNCLVEKSKNDNESIAMVLGKSHEARKAFLCFKGFSDSNLEKDNAIDYYNRAIDEYKENIRSVAKSYLEFSKTDLSIMTYYYGKMDFFFANKTIRNFVYIDIYSKIWNTRSDVMSVAFDYELLLDNKGNSAVCIDKTRSIERQLFRIEESTVGEYKCLSVYFDTADQISDSLEKLISYTRKGRKTEYQKHIPVKGIMTLQSESQTERVKIRNRSMI